MTTEFLINGGRGFILGQVVSPGTMSVDYERLRSALNDTRDLDRVIHSGIFCAMLGAVLPNRKEDFKLPWEYEIFQIIACRHKVTLAGLIGEVCQSELERYAANFIALVAKGAVKVPQAPQTLDSLRQSELDIIRITKIVFIPDRPHGTIRRPVFTVPLLFERAKLFGDAITIEPAMLSEGAIKIEPES